MEVSNQEVFDTVIQHLVKQGHPSIKDLVPVGQTRCRYLNDFGDKCAVGCLITDDEYHPHMENFSSDTLFEKYPETVFARKYGSNQAILRELQGVHDTQSNWEYPSNMWSALSVVAATFMLNTTMLDSLDFSNIKENRL